MKELLAFEFFFNPLKEWGITFFIIIGAIFLGKILYWFFGKILKSLADKTKTKIDDIIIDMIEEPVVLALTIVGLWYGLHRLYFPDEWYNFMGKVYHVLIVINITWLVARLIDAIIVEYVIPLTEKTKSDIDNQLIPIVRKVIRSMIWVLGIIVALNNVGYDVGALIAGLGIGGLALSLAAKDSIANIFGGIMIFTDKPFKVGDRIKIKGFDGVIEDVGIRTSRMRTLEGRLVTIPNALFIGDMVENVSAEPTRKVTLNIGLTYDMTAPQMEKGISLLKEIVLDNPAATDNVLVSFNSFGDFSLGLLLIYYIKKESDILATQTQINLEILKQFNQHGLEMAFPTQTIYTK